MSRAALHVVISDFKVFIVFVALGLPFPQVHLSVGGVNRLTQAVEFPQVLLVHNNMLAHGTVTNNDDVGLHE